MLTLLVAMVFAVLANEQYPIDSQIVAAKGQCIGDRGHDLHLWKAQPSLICEIALRMLIDIEGDDIHRRSMMSTIPAISFQESIDDVLTV
jgi:hypothetical protein